MFSKGQKNKRRSMNNRKKNQIQKSEDKMIDYINVSDYNDKLFSVLENYGFGVFPKVIADIIRKYICGEYLALNYIGELNVPKHIKFIEICDTILIDNNLYILDSGAKILYTFCCVRKQFVKILKLNFVTTHRRKIFDIFLPRNILLIAYWGSDVIHELNVKNGQCKNTYIIGSLGTDQYIVNIGDIKLSGDGTKLFVADFCNAIIRVYNIHNKELICNLVPNKIFECNNIINGNRVAIRINKQDDDIFRDIRLDGNKLYVLCEQHSSSNTKLAFIMIIFDIDLNKHINSFIISYKDEILPNFFTINNNKIYVVENVVADNLNTGDPASFTFLYFNIHVYNMNGDYIDCLSGTTYSDTGLSNISSITFWKKDAFICGTQLNSGQINGNVVSSDENIPNFNTDKIIMCT